MSGLEAIKVGDVVVASATMLAVGIFLPVSPSKDNALIRTTLGQYSIVVAIAGLMTTILPAMGNPLLGALRWRPPPR